MLGFRSNKLWKKILSIAYLLFWGMMLLIVVFDGKYKNITTYDHIINKIQNMVLLLIFVTPYIFLSKTKMREKLPLFKDYKKVKSFLGLIIINFMLFVAFGIINGCHSQEYLADMENHDYVITNKVEATCTVSGKINYLCDYCGLTKTEVISAIGHDMKEVSRKGAACEESGMLYEKCSRCGYDKETELSVLGHDMQETSREEASCEEDGCIYEKCSRCEHTSEKKITALGHDMQETSRKEASCEEDGCIYEKCSRCDKTSEKTLSGTGHDMKKTSEQKATCEKDGKIVNKCSKCGYEEKKVTKATGHKMKEAGRTNPTENADGKIVRKCETCGTEEVETIRRLGKTKEEYMAECNWYPYEEIARYPDDYNGKLATYYGQVVQVQENGNNVVIRMNVTHDMYDIWKDTIYIEYVRGANEGRILEYDMVTVYGELKGIKTYTTVRGDSVSIPYMKCKYIAIN